MAEGFLSRGSIDLILVVLFVSLQLLSNISGAEALETGGNRGRRVLGDWRKEQEADRVVLPEQPAVKFAQYAGMVTVDATTGREYFYFFVESPEHASEKPLTLWLNGGPGCSSLAYGFAEEFGPYRILPDASGVYLHDNAWNKESNMLFLESPSGVGFSFSKNYSENQEGGDKRTAEDNYLFLLNWFERFPEYKDRDFYIAGESYAGHYVPQLAKLIVDSNPEAKLKINLKGILAGNPVTDAYWDNVGNIDYRHSHALLSDQTWEKMKAACNFSDPNCCSSACYELHTYAETTELGAIDPYSIYTNNCVDLIGISSVRRKAPLSVRPQNPFMRASRGYDPCIGSYAEAYFNRPEVQRAIHANVSGIIPYNWTGCRFAWLVRLTHCTWFGMNSWQYGAAKLDRFGLFGHPCVQGTNQGQTKDFGIQCNWKLAILNILEGALFTSGDADAVVPVTSTRYALAAMKLPIKKHWQAWYHHLQVGGRVLEYEGLTFVTIRGAGHEVPLLQAGRAFHMFKSFLAAKSLPKAPYE